MSILVGRKAPPINAKAVVGTQVQDFSLNSYLGKKYVILLFYPKNFTYVCPTELHAFQDSLPRFEQLNTALVACSTDTEQSHMDWLKKPKASGGIQGITYPILVDSSRTISKAYDVLSSGIAGDSEDSRIPFRALFLIDKFGVVQHQLINNMPFGRNVEEAIRMLEAVQHFETNKEVCPANWAKGKQALKPTVEATAKFLSSQS